MMEMSAARKVKLKAVQEALTRNPALTITHLMRAYSLAWNTLQDWRDAGLITLMPIQRVKQRHWSSFEYGAKPRAERND